MKRRAPPGPRSGALRTIQVVPQSRRNLEVSRQLASRARHLDRGIGYRMESEL